MLRDALCLVLFPLSMNAFNGPSVGKQTHCNSLGHGGLLFGFLANVFFKKRREKCTVWSSLILKRSSVWLLCLAASEFPALGPVGGAPNGL